MVAFCCYAVLCQDYDVKTQGEISLTNTNPLPSKHDVICCLAVAGRWITSLQDLQVSSVFGRFPNTCEWHVTGSRMSMDDTGLRVMRRVKRNSKSE